MEEQLNPLAVTHLLQHTLRSFCNQDHNSHWLYAVFWRILPRNYPPPKWDLQGGAYDRTRGNRRNWILVWEDGFCNFAASTAYGECEMKGLQPELFFKMSHEIYNFGEGLIGKVAADHSHKWVFKEPQDHEVNFLSSWNNPADSQPRTWEAQFQAGIETIALVAVREGVVQLGSINKVMEDMSFVVLLRKKFHYLESIPGVLLPHPSSAAFPARMDGFCYGGVGPPESWPFLCGPSLVAPPPPMELYDHFSQQVAIAPSMSSLEALLSKLPSVCPQSAAQSSSPPFYEIPSFLPVSQKASMGVVGMERVAKEEMEEEYSHDKASTMSYYVSGTKPSEGL